ncbi:prepilin-type N-terminal cleavage/methylation domain-containing protein [Xylanivirga thermophila]|uniref:prepilin-type N-terminal cleavage/methylation domain-containing protein n=1 Tax=Xylanivirga thermophila TaxID=2496273 RepID=UPI00101DD02A|nr:prepilin-type N-terminal cleavage/methylation domain-containing protein [Xylanivirga thermophila]
MDKKGFTLVELILAMSLLSIILVLILNFTHFTVSNYKYATVQSYALQSANNALYTIEDDVRQARSPRENEHAIEILDAGKGLKVYLTVPNTASYYTVLYKLDRGNLIREEDGDYDNQKIVARDIANKDDEPVFSLSASKSGKQIIAVHMLIKEDKHSKPVDISTQISMRVNMKVKP